MTVFGLVLFNQFTLEKELHLVDFAVFKGETVFFGKIFANVDQFANADLGTDFFKDFTLERLVQGLTKFLTAPRQNGVRANAILLAQDEQFAILDDDSFDRIPQFLLFHFVRILPHNRPNTLIKIERLTLSALLSGQVHVPKNNRK